MGITSESIFMDSTQSVHQIGSYDLRFFGLFLYFSTLGDFSVGDTPLPNFAELLTAGTFLGSDFNIDFKRPSDDGFGRIWSGPLSVRAANEVEIVSKSLFECSKNLSSEFQARARLIGDLAESALETRWYIDGELKAIGDSPALNAPLGKSILSVEVDDASGKTFSDTKKLAVVDTTPPTVAIVLSDRKGNEIDDLAPRGTHELNVDVSVVDVCDPEVEVVSVSGVAIGLESKLKVNVSNGTVSLDGDELQVMVNAKDLSGNETTEKKFLAIGRR